jgi:putative nucleotidyltransferase with HDIG domain
MMPSRPAASRAASQGVVVALVTGVTVLLEHVAQFPAFHLLPGVSIFYPSTAWAIISFYLFGPWAVPGLVLGTILAPWSPGTSLARGTLKGLVLCLEGLFPYLILLQSKADVSLRKHGTVARFLLLGLLGGTLANSAAGTLIQLYRYPQNLPEYPLRWTTWWVSDLISAFLLALPILLLVQPLLQKLSPALRKQWLDPIHLRPVYGRAVRLRIPPRNLAVLGGVFVVLWAFTLLGTGVAYAAAVNWFAFLFFLPVVFLGLRGGFPAGVYGATATSWGLLVLVFARGLPEGGAAILVTLYLNLLSISTTGLLAGILAEANAYRMVEVQRLKEFASRLVAKKAAPEVLRELASTLLQTLHIKAVIIEQPEQEGSQVFPEGAEVGDGEATSRMELQADGVRFGSLTLVKEDATPFTQRDLETAETVIRQAAIALDNSRLYENLEYRVKELKALFDVAKNLLVTLDLETLLYQTVHSLTQAFHLSIGCIFLRGEGGVLELRAVSGMGQDAKLVKVVPVNMGVVGRCFITGKLQYAPEVSANPDYIEVSPGIHTELAVPLLAEGEVLGVLNMESYLPDAYRGEDIRLIRAVASQLSLAIAQVHLHKQLEKANVSLKDTYYDTIQALCNAVEAKDQYTQGHVERTATFALEVGLRLGLSEEHLDRLRLSAMLHDIGKIGIPEEILQKPGFLTPQEREVMKKHVEIGVQILQQIEFLRPAIPGIFHHQEWYGGYDGKTAFGYPTGIQGDAIPIESRIIGVVDSFDAMTSTRPYRPAMPWDEAVKRLIVDKGRQFDPDIVDTFIDILQASYNYRLPKELRAMMEAPPMKGVPPAGMGLDRATLPPLA